MFCIVCGNGGATRNGDGMLCIAQSAASATAIEIAPLYCAKLRLRSRAMFNVTCSDYRAGGVLDADYVTWWNQLPHLTNAQVQYADAVFSYNGSMAQLRRRTGLDQVQACPVIELPAEKPDAIGVEQVPIEPTPNVPSCEASQIGV